MKQRICGFIMALATVVSVLGTLPFLRHDDPAGPGASLGDGLMLFIWGFGLLGVLLCFIADAARKRLFALLAFGWSMAAVVWDAVRNACPENIACARETNDHAALLGMCLLLVAALFAYEKYRRRLPAAGHAVAKGVAHVLLVIWSIALLLAAISVNSSIPLAKVQALKSPAARID